MQNIQFLPHTADVRIHLEADTLENLFVASASSIAELLKPGFCQEKPRSSIEHIIEIKAIDTTILLIDFLSDVLTLSYTEKAIFCTVKVSLLPENGLSAVITGIPVDGFDEDIKAVTYHEANVHQNPDGHWETMVIVDI